MTILKMLTNWEKTQQQLRTRARGNPSLQLEIEILKETVRQLEELMDRNGSLRAAGELELVRLIGKQDDSYPGNPTKWPVSDFIGRLKETASEEAVLPAEDSATDEGNLLDEEYLSDETLIGMVKLMEQKGIEHDRSCDLPRECLALYRYGNIQTVSWNFGNPMFSVARKMILKHGIPVVPMEWPENAIYLYRDGKPHRVVLIEKKHG